MNIKEQLDMDIDLSVICVGLKHSGNLGAIARVCDNFDVKQLILVQPECQVDDRAYERATKGRRYLDNVLILDSLDEAKIHADIMIGLTARISGKNSLHRTVISITEISNKIHKHKGAVAVVLGREDFGLNREEVNSCDLLAYIPMPGQNPVLNVSHAASLALWELVRGHFAGKEDPEEEVYRLMSRDEKDSFMNFLDQILDHAWLDPRRRFGVTNSYSSILSRALVTQREVNALIGAMRGIYRSVVGDHPPWDSCDKATKDE